MKNDSYYIPSSVDFWDDALENDSIWRKNIILKNDF